jgi:hypothetical protein
MSWLVARFLRSLCRVSDVLRLLRQWAKQRDTLFPPWVFTLKMDEMAKYTYNFRCAREREVGDLYIALDAMVPTFMPQVRGLPKRKVGPTLPCAPYLCIAHRLPAHPPASQHMSPAHARLVPT